MNLINLYKAIKQGSVAKAEVYAICAEDVIKIVEGRERLEQKIRSLEVEKAILELELEQRPKRLEFVTYA